MSHYSCKADFDCEYDLAAEPWGVPAARPEVRLHYNRAVLLPWCRRRAARLVTTLGLRPGDKVVIVGAAFGWTVEELRARGIDAIGTDTSAWVHSVKDTSERPEIEDAVRAVGVDPASPDGAALVDRIVGDDGPRCRVTVMDADVALLDHRLLVIAALGGTPSWVISESVLESLTDDEARALSDGMNALGTNAAHVVLPPHVDRVGALLPHDLALSDEGE